MAALKRSAEEPEVSCSPRLLPRDFLPCEPITQHMGSYLHE